MTDQPGRELGLGHLGQASYDTEQHTWSYNRQSLDAPTITWLREPVNLVATDRNTSSQEAHHLGQNSIRVSDFDHGQHVRGSRDQTHLELLDSHRRDEGMSKAITQSLSKYDPLKGDLLVSGSLVQRFEDGHARGHVPFVLLAGGLSDNQLRLLASDEVQYKVEAETAQGISLERRLTTYVPGLEQTRWSGPGVAVQQICLSHVLPAGEGLRTGLGQNTLAAARLGEKTVLFRIDRGGSHAAPGSSNRVRLRSTSSINLSVLLEIDSSQTFDHAHADVAFNPWFNQQIAIVDHAGHVSILDFEWNNADHRYAITASQSMPRSSRSNEPTSEFLNDGWARVLWVAHVSTLAVALRHELRIVDISDNETLSIPKLGLNDTSNWILDMRRHPANLNHLFVLTNTRVYWLRVLSRQQDGAERSMTPGANLLYSARHFRDVSDVTMQLAVIAQDETTSVFITSKLNSSITSLHFRTAAEEPDESIALGSPVNFTATKSQEGHRNMDFSAQQTLFLAASVGDPVHQPTTMSTGGDLPTIIHVQTLQRDFSVRQSFLCLELEQQSSHSEVYLSLDLDSATRTKLLKNKSYHSILPGEEDDFVVSDDHLSEGDCSQRSRAYMSRSKGPVVMAGPLHRSARFDFPRRTYASLLSQEVVISRTEEAVLYQSGVGSLATALEDARRLQKQPMGSLFELSEPLQIHDIDELSKALNQLMDNVPLASDGQPRVHLDSGIIMQFMHNLPSSSSEQQQLSQIYRFFVEQYLKPLSKKTSGRYRIGLDKVLRRLALDIVLAATVASVPIGEIPEGPDTGHEELMLDASTAEGPPTEALDVKHPTSSRAASMALGDFNLQSDADPQSSKRAAYPTPAFSQASVPPSPYFLSTPTSSMFESSTAQPTTDARLRSLSSFVAFSAPPPPLRSTTNRILSHWTLGEDPTTYDYTAQQALLDRARDRAEEEELQKGMSGKARRRLARRTERRSQRLDQQSQSQQMQSSQAPFAATQPTLSAGAGVVIRHLFSSTQGMPLASTPSMAMPSSQMQPSMQLASQREPGKFGGRPPARKKVKMSGFR